MIPKASKFLRANTNWGKIHLFCLAFVLSYCQKPLQTNSYYENSYATGTKTQHSGIAQPFMKDKYAIDVFVKPQKPEFEVVDIQEISFGSEALNGSKEQLVKGRMVQRGQNIEEKKQLIALLVQKAEELGATCLYNVNYQYYTDQRSSGYVISGMAARYSLHQNKAE
jgi:hypothetical protein